MHRHHQHAHRHGAYLGILNSPRLQQDNLPRNRPPHLIMPEDPTLVKRELMPTTESDRVEPCAPGDNSGRCEKPTSSASNTVYPIVLGVVIPIVCAIVVLFFLHRRNLRKLRNEDANDKHRSLDFGLDFAPSGNKSMREKDVAQNHHMKGLSFDIGPSPYMLPPSLRNSKESLNSLSRSMMVDDDKYRHAHQYFNPENQSIRSQRRGYDDTVSVAGSTRKGAFSDDMNQGLIGNAQRISRSSPPLHNSSGEPIEQSPVKHGQVPEPGFELHLPRSPSPVHISGLAPIYETSPATDSKEVYVSTSGSAPSSSLPEHQPDFPLRESLPGHVESTPAPSKDAPIPMPRISLPPSDGASDYGDERISNPIVPAVNVQKADSNPSYEADVNNPHMPILPDEPPQPSDLRLDPRRDTRRMTMGLRPLPPEDPADNPEQRANRIRSFYKEYFDESKAEQRETYYEDYGSDYYPYDDDYVYDPVTGEYFDAVPAPYAEPLNRRAMTPPPRAPPRFQGTPRHMASGSIGGYSGYSERFQAPGPRAFSSASGRFPGARGPRRPLPPPSPLTVLPSPHLLKDDAIMTAIDFAPGSSFKDQREGRPETPLGGMRPYSPMVRAHTPLVSVFDDLAPIPSPHQLRKSGAFDNLDFAPLPRFKTQDTASDAGSIRSNRTGVSAAHLQNIRTGAYRVSRLPPETVGTRDDLMSNLRPTWDMRQ